MFERQEQDEIEAMMKSDAQFRVLYQHHQELDSKVHDAEIGALPMDGTTLSTLKREKLHLKDRLTHMWQGRPRATAG
ncbi:MAG TPA: YdcH family protein [Gammaproteobacteria bacterium]|nr:YdcH family protein [Gammaproteobacteria bacterium]